MRLAAIVSVSCRGVVMAALCGAATVATAQGRLAAEAPDSVVGGDAAPAPDPTMVPVGGGGTDTGGGGTPGGTTGTGPAGLQPPVAATPARVSAFDIGQPVIVAGHGEVVAMCPPGQIALTGGARSFEALAMQAALIESRPFYEPNANPILNIAPRGWAGKGSAQYTVLTGGAIVDTGVIVWAVCATPVP